AEDGIESDLAFIDFNCPFRATVMMSFLFAPQVSGRETFDFWLDAEAAKDPQAQRQLEEAKGEIGRAS
ncbi:hypothetical protein Q604_UNBC09453G0001, partial [human gut metagenome]